MSNRKKLKHQPAAGTTLSERTTKRLHEIQSTFSGKYNGYLCDGCGKGFLTLDIDHGTTPMFSSCFATEGCESQAYSMGYPKGEPPLEFGEPIIHWYKPSETDLQIMPSGVRTYVDKGGLIRKASEYAPDWVRAKLAA